MSYSLTVVASGQENVALLKSYTGDSLLIGTNGNSNFYKNVDISGTLSYTNIEFGLFNTFLNGLTKVVNKNSFTQFGSLGTSTEKWFGGVLAPNGKIYGIPYSATSVLVIDPVARTAVTNVITVPTNSSLSGNYKWWGGVMAQNGKIYGIPGHSRKILVIDPVAKTAKTDVFTDVINGSDKWWGGTLAPNGKIYGIPRDTTKVLIINPNNSSHTLINTTLTGGWSGGVLAPNGKIYCVPRDSKANKVILVINTTNDTVSTTLKTTVNGFQGAVLAPNGKIYGFGGNTILIIDPDKNTATTFGTISGAYWGSVLGLNGKIYSIPFYGSTTQILEFDPVNNTFTYFGTGIVDANAANYMGGVLAPNGKIYGIPRTDSQVLEIIPYVNNPDFTINNTWMLEPYFNKL